jgi:hypothetical protein
MDEYEQIVARAARAQSISRWVRYHIGLDRDLGKVPAQAPVPTPPRKPGGRKSG